MKLFAQLNSQLRADLLILCLLALSLATAPALAQSSAIAGFGPLDTTPPANITPAQLIVKMGARETAFAHARDNYTFRQSVKVDIINQDTGKADGEYYEVTDITFDPTGRRMEHVVFAPQSSLDNSATPVMMSESDFQDIAHRLPFVLTTDDLPQYNVTYVGRQKVDELQTYVFDAAPKVIEKNHRYFKGRVWIDQQDNEIVLINGKNVPDDTRRGHEDLSPPFTTYYQQVDGKYWFPTYTRAEGMLHFTAQEGALAEDVHLRTIVKYTDYKQFRATSRIIYNGQDITPNQPTNTPPQPDSTPPPSPQ